MESKSIKEIDVCILGAGPAGMKAAMVCSDNGAKVILLDEQPSPGGQIYRAVSNQGQRFTKILGTDYQQGFELTKKLYASKVEYVSEATVWRIDSDRSIYWSKSGKAYQIKAKRIIIATGAIERPFPFEGWTLPGVMTAGAGQIMLKTSGLVAKNAILVGTGPLLYLLAVQMLKAGQPPIALVDTIDIKAYLKSARYLRNALGGANYIIKGLGLMNTLRKAGIKHYTGATEIAAFGTDEVESLKFRSRRTSYQINCNVVLSHIGVVPNVQLSRAMGIEHTWDERQYCWRPKLDEFNNTSIKGISIAGDGSGIGGAKTSEFQGELSGIEALYQLQLIDENTHKTEASKLKRLIERESTIRPFLEVLYAPPEQAFTPKDNTIVCRCENVTAGTIREQLQLDSKGMNQLKVFSRCGMGPCQGRTCGQIISHMTSNQMRIPVENIPYFHIRFPIKPLKLGELASLTPYKFSYMNKYVRKERSHESN